jgi:hypothetical protein
MTAIMTARRALATAGSYLRVNHRTRAADIVPGSQVDYVLTDIYDDHQVKPQAGGGFVVTADDWTVIQYVPLHSKQDLRQLADAYKHWAAPGDGKKFHEQKPMDGKGLAVLIRRAPGAFYLTQSGEIAHLDRGKIRNQYKPLAAADLAAAA